jgi:hypothetical protein
MREQLQPMTWRKSSRSSHTNCVEVALSPEVVAVRDSKDRRGPVLTFSAAAFGEFLAGLKQR